MALNRVDVQSAPEQAQSQLAPDRMMFVRWPREGVELYLDDMKGDGQVRAEIDRRWQVVAVIGHAAGVLHTVVWQQAACIWGKDERAAVKHELSEILANRGCWFQLGGMRFRPHVTIDPTSGNRTVFVYRTDLCPEVLVAVKATGGLVLAPGDHRGYLDAAVLADAVEGCLGERTAP